jgi:PST family polysaccharide transporter
MSLLHRAARGGIFLLAGQLLILAAGWGIDVLLRRLLTREDFGLVAMATVIQGFLGVITDLGLTAALIQRKNLEVAHNDAAFWSSLGMGVCLFLLSCALAPAIALTYGEPRVTPVVMFSAVTLLLGPFWSTHASLLRRELRFKALASIETARAITSGVVSVVGAAWGLGHWAIVAGPISSHLVAVVAYSVADKSWKPGLRATRRHARELFSFSLYMAGSAALNYTGSNVDNFLVGRSLGAAALGTYVLAYQMMTFPFTRISALFSQVLYPAFATVQDKLDEMRPMYLKASRSLALINFPVLAWMAVAAPEIVGVIYGQRWVAAVPVLQILCIAGALRSVGTLVGFAFRCRGKAHVEFYWNIAWVILLSGGILIGVRFGTSGVAVAISGLFIPGVCFTEWLACRYLEMPFRRLLRALALPAGAALLSTALGFAAREPLQAHFSGGAFMLVVRLVVLTLWMLGIYVGMLRLLHPPIVSEAKAFIGYFRAERVAPGT